MFRRMRMKMKMVLRVKEFWARLHTKWFVVSVEMFTKCLTVLCARQVHSLARAATCNDPNTDTKVPLLDLHLDDLHCRASPLSDSAHAPAVATPTASMVGLATLLILLTPTLLMILGS